MLRFKQYLVEGDPKKIRREQDKIAKEAPIGSPEASLPTPEYSGKVDRSLDDVESSRLRETQRQSDVKTYGIDVEDIKNQIRSEESGGNMEKITGVYPDPIELLTLGHGHLVTNQTPNILKQTFPWEVNKNSKFVDSIMMGGKRLTMPQVETLFDTDVRTRLQQMTKAIPQFTEFNNDLKSALSSEWFRGLLPQSKQTLKLINSGNFKQAGIEYKNSSDYKGKKDKAGNIIQKPLAGVIKRIDRVSNALTAHPSIKPLSTKPAELPVDDEDISK
jgi:hypothetical protein